MNEHNETGDTSLPEPITVTPEQLEQVAAAASLAAQAGSLYSPTRIIGKVAPPDAS